MLERLKSLPLTILLTVLIWMYAEAQFTATQSDVPINIGVSSGSQDFAVRVYDQTNKRYSNMLNVVATLQGPRNQLDQILQEALGAAHVNPTEDRMAALTYTPSADQLRQAVANGGEFNAVTLPMLNRLDYFQSRGVTVTYAQPSSVSIEVDTVARVRKEAAFQSSVAVENVTVDPATVEVQIPSQTLREVGENKIVVHAVPQNDAQLAALPPDTDKVIPVRFVADYPGPRDERIRLQPAQGNATVRVKRAQQGVLGVGDVPIWVSGPPGLLSRYNIEVTPQSVGLMLSGPSALVDATRQRLSGGPKGAGISAYLDLTPEDHPEPGGVPVRRALRYILPDGLSLLQSPPEASFKLTEKTPATTPTATTTQPGTR
jgi:hypothetical protein